MFREIPGEMWIFEVIPGWIPSEILWGNSKAINSHFLENVLNFFFGEIHCEIFEKITWGIFKVISYPRIIFKVITGRILNKYVVDFLNKKPTWRSLSNNCWSNSWMISFGEIPYVTSLKE